MDEEECSGLLVVDDDQVLCQRLAKALRERGLTVFEACNGEEAKSLLAEKDISHITLDLRLGNESGMKLIEEFLTIKPETVILILTGYGSIATAVEAVKKGAVHYLTKPAHTDKILEALGLLEPSEQVEEGETPSLSQVEWDHLQRVMDDCGGNISKAAKVLGMHRRSLQRKLQKAPFKLK